jgi:hypothetical protein
MQALYRSDYAGEFVVVETKWTGGKKQQKREWVPNPIENHHISGRAACIGSQTDLSKFNYKKLEKHRGGLLGSKKLQTYGIGSIAKEMKLDFVCETNADALQEFIQTDYCDTHVVYTSGSNCLAYPEKFYLIPYNQRFLDLDTIIYLAAFDGHQEIFLLGYNKDTSAGRPDWYQEIVKIMRAYTGTRFYFIGEVTNMYDDWFECVNAQHMTYREFITYCDI